MNELASSDSRNAAIEAERSGGEAALAPIWQDLIQGRQRVVDAFFTRDRCFLVLSANHGAARALAGRRRYVLERLLGGQNAKSLAFELGIALSTVSQDAKLAVSHLGFTCSAGRVHPLLVMAARTTDNAVLSTRARSGWLRHGTETYRVIGARRPEEQLSPVLPPAELAVVRGLVEGQNYREIAASRGTSTRTVANQLAAAFKKLGVSGRYCLLEHLTRA